MSTQYAVTMDPLHIGTGGYRLGRVDNTIIRDPGTNLPKIPGSSLAGVIRSYVTMTLHDDGEAKMCATELTGGERGNCGACEVCMLFGHAAHAGKDSKSRIGLLRFYDGRIVAFPVYTLAGTVWVTCPAALTAIGQSSPYTPKQEEIFINFDLPGGAQQLNLGWLYLPTQKKEGAFIAKLPQESKELFTRQVLAPDWLFSEIVNSNLEVRTSVSIDFETGAAESGKLFTYEAIPAGTLLAFDVEIDTHRSFEKSEQDIKNILKPAFKQCAVLGMGGMTTRGFGRVRFFEEDV